MRVSRIFALVIAACLLLTISGHAQNVETLHAGSTARGLRLADNWCSSCHLVSPEQKTSSRGAPPFSEIAQSQTFNSDHLAYLLNDPHPKMAKLALSRRAIDDIAAYVLSLRK
jgi:mono/diheme cytochrome c family protein